MDEDRRREDEWFQKNEKQLLESARLARQKREQERAAGEKLEEVKVDRCSHCEGIYFDAGELDQVLLKKEEARKGFFKKLVKI